VRIEHGDCLEVMQALIDEGVTVQSCVTDPPYHLTSIVKRFGKTNINGAGTNEARARAGADGMARLARGFMGKQWDGGDIAFKSEVWRLVYDLLPPGGYLLAFGGTRTYHRMACAVEDAGFEIRDQIGWLFGSGFPKSHAPMNGMFSLSRSTSKASWRKWHRTVRILSGTALKPAWEPIVVARKPFKGTVAENVMEHGTGALNVDGCRVEGRERTEYGLTNAKRSRLAVYGEPTESADFDSTKGRWPANVIHDGSEEVLEAFKRFGGGRSAGNYPSESIGTGNGTTYLPQKPQGQLYADAGSPARFFYSSKADKSDRLGSKHPTVKPVDLMAYLCRLVTPPGGTVLDPFAGSGSTGMACLREGFECILIEREAEYIRDIKARMEHVKGHDLPLYSAQPDTLV